MKLYIVPRHPRRTPKRVILVHDLHESGRVPFQADGVTSVVESITR